MRLIESKLQYSVEIAFFFLIGAIPLCSIPYRLTIWVTTHTVHAYIVPCIYSALA